MPGLALHIRMRPEGQDLCRLSLESRRVGAQLLAAARRRMRTAKFGICRVKRGRVSIWRAKSQSVLLIHLPPSIGAGRQNYGRAQEDQSAKRLN